MGFLLAVFSNLQLINVFIYPKIHDFASCAQFPLTLMLVLAVMQDTFARSLPIVDNVDRVDRYHRIILYSP